MAEGNPGSAGRSSHLARYSSSLSSPSSILCPTPSRQEWYVLLCTLGLAAGAIAALLPGSIDWSVKPGLRVTGALAVAALVVWLGKSFAPGDSAETEPRRVTASMAFEKCATSPDNIQRTDVYVAVDGKLVLADIRNPDAPLPAATAAPASSVKCSSPQQAATCLRKASTTPA
jgi:hypothetical protein